MSRALFLAGMALAVAASAVPRARESSHTPRELCTSETYAFTAEGLSTPAELDALYEAIVSGAPCPSKFRLVDYRGGMAARVSGLPTNPDGSHLVVFEATEDTADVDHIDFYHGGDLEARLTRANGMISDDAGIATGEVAMRIPESPGSALNFQWFDVSGRCYRSSTFVLGEVP